MALAMGNPPGITGGNQEDGPGPVVLAVIVPDLGRAS
jgi:hypothetical protein